MRSLALVAFLATVHSTVAASADSVGRAIDNIPEALRLIRTADEVYIMPVVCTRSREGGLTPHGGYKHVRRLGVDARRRLQRLLGKESNWFHGNDSTITIAPEPKNVGFIFRKGRGKLVLLAYMWWRFEGTFDGEPTGGSLEERPSYKFDRWKKQYAKQELGLNET